MHKGHYLVCYDITDHKRLQKVFRISRRYGVAFQYSVVYLHASQDVVDTLLAELADVIDHGSDDVRAYRIRSLQQIQTLGEPIQPSGIVW